MKPPRGAKPVPGAPGYVISERGETWHHNGRASPWSRWTRLSARTIGGEGGPSVRLVIEGREAYRSVSLLLRAAFAPDPTAWSQRIAAGLPRRPPRPPRPVRPPALPPSAPPYVAPPSKPPAATLPPIPGPVGPLDAEPLVLRGDITPLCGEANGRHRLTAGQVVEARRLRRGGWTLAALARLYKVSPGTLGYACREDGKGTWGCVPAE